MTRSFAPSLLALCLTATRLDAQPPTQVPAVTEAGAGAETFVLITGMVGGVAGYRRLEALLVARYYRVIVVDPYELSIDSTDVSFAAMARRVNVVLEERGVSHARVVAHS